MNFTDKTIKAKFTTPWFTSYLGPAKGKATQPQRNVIIELKKQKDAKEQSLIIFKETYIPPICHIKSNHNP